MAWNLFSIFLVFLPVVIAIEWPPDAEICRDVVCKKPKGSWCTPQYKKSGKLKAVCECPTDCPDVFQPVCSVYGRQYDSLCHMHLYTCKKRKNIPKAYDGLCIASQKKCKDDEFQQFPVRLLDWFLHLHEIDEFGRLDPNTNIKQKTSNERLMYATWKFNLLDDDGDGKLDKKDLLNFRYSLMPLEHCADDFFKTCASPKSKKITMEGWLECLKVYDTTEYPEQTSPDTNNPDVTETEEEDLDEDIDDFFGDFEDDDEDQ